MSVYSQKNAQTFTKENKGNEFVIITDNLTKKYGNRTVVNSINLKVPKKSIFGFLGPNGSGKTTTIKMLLGLIKPASGNISIFGKDIKQNSNEIKNRLGYLAQQPQFYNFMTAYEIMKFRAKFFFQSKEVIENRIKESLELVKLEDLASQKIKGFSGGECQRLGIALAIVNEPDLLILDEPAAALDPMGRHDVLRIMENLREKSTILYSTHILDDVQKVSDTVAILNHGNLLAQAPIESLLKGNNSVSVYEIGIKNCSKDLTTLISTQEYVSSVNTQKINNQAIYEITVTDEEACENNLLKTILSEDNMRISKFVAKNYELEDIFLQLTEV